MRCISSMAASVVIAPETTSGAYRSFIPAPIMPSASGSATGSTCPARACYHDSCSSLREMGVSVEPRALLRSVEGLTVRDFAETQVCCGFGGFFSVKYPEISARMADDKIADAKARGADTIIIDTAGRLHTKANLMAELEKVRRIIERRVPGAPHETLLVLDAVTGQNGLMQAKTFVGSVGVTGLVLTKLDSSAKGGVVFAIAEELKLPIKLIGTGERVEDVQPFDPQEFVRALFA